MTSIKEQFTTKEAARILNLKPVSIMHYVKEGLIVPGVANPQGKGKVRLYSRTNLVEIKLLKELVKFGMPLHNFNEIIARIRVKNAIIKLNRTEIENQQNLTVPEILEKRRAINREYLNKHPWGDEFFKPDFIKNKRVFLIISGDYTTNNFSVDLQRLSLYRKYPEEKVISKYISILKIDLTELFNQVNELIVKSYLK